MFPVADTGDIDYKTLGNILAGTLMGEVSTASIVDYYHKKIQKYTSQRLSVIIVTFMITLDCKHTVYSYSLPYSIAMLGSLAYY